MVLREAWLRWCMTDSVRQVALIRPGFRRPTFPPGEGSAYAVQLCKVVPPKKAFPEGEGGREADE